MYVGIVTVSCLYAGLQLGATYREMEEPNLFEAFAGLGEHITFHPFRLFPADALMVGIFLFVAVMIDLYLYNEYLRVSQAVYDAHGDAAFEDNLEQYNREFLYKPKIVAAVEGKIVMDKLAPYNEEHKRVLRYTPCKRAIKECKKKAFILARDLYLAFISPNLLQIYGCYIITTPPGKRSRITGKCW